MRTSKTLKSDDKSSAITENLFFSIPVFLLFGIVYVCSGTFLYVEGDDASSVAYHALGRNSYIQHPYSPYHGMMDVFLSVLPANEILIRHVAISITAASAVLVILLTLSLVYEWLALRGLKVVLITFLILLSVPEIFYLSLIYAPSYTALLFALAAHKLLRGFCLSQKPFEGNSFVTKISFILSAAALGIGTACRWDIGLYLIVIVADILFGIYVRSGDDVFEIRDNRQTFYQKAKLAALYGACAVLFSILAIKVSGYDAMDLFNIARLANNEITVQGSIFSRIGSYQTLFTPAFLLFFIVGYVYLFREKRNLAVFIFASVFPFLIYVYSQEPKMLLPALPGLFLAVAAGIYFVCFKMPNGNGLIIKAVAVLVVLCPWFIGVQINSKDTLWGPDFDVKTVNRIKESENENNIIEDSVGNRSVSVNGFAVIFKAGFAVPTGEGWRPIGGHFYALISGQWKALIKKLARERSVAAQKAISEHVPIFQYGRNSMLVTKFSEMGYKTQDSRNSISPDDIYIRKFSNGNSEVIIYASHPPVAFFTKKMAKNLIKLNCKKVILYSAYSSAMKRLNDIAPESMEVLGPLTAAVNLEILVKSDNLPE